MMNYITSLVAFFITSFYSLSYNSNEGNAISMSAYIGKKVLIVNIATGSINASQIGGLQQLHELFGDSLVIIAVPSNYFNNESHTNAEIKSICQTQYGATFQIAEKVAVGGTQISPLYNWLTHVSENGGFNEQVFSDFTKFLVDKEGNLVGVYSSSVLPASARMINSINQH